MPKVIDLSYEDVAKSLSYVPETGKFYWITSPAKNVKVGDEAGTFKGIRTNRKTGKHTRYQYIRLSNYDIPSARIAWVLMKNEWPYGNVLFKDSDPSNLKWGNLEQAKVSIVTTGTDGKKKHSTTKEAQRHYGLKRYYNLSLQEYGEKLLNQNGKCAICEGPETAIMHGNLKALSVDHSHKTGKIRGLLCTQCNYLIGHSRERRDILLSAVRYLDKHSGTETAPSLRIVGD